MLGRPHDRQRRNAKKGGCEREEGLGSESLSQLKDATLRDFGTRSIAHLKRRVEEVQRRQNRLAIDFEGSNVMPFADLKGGNISIS
jgi:hypothetical protein